MVAEMVTVIPATGLGANSGRDSRDSHDDRSYSSNVRFGSRRERVTVVTTTACCIAAMYVATVAMMDVVIGCDRVELEQRP